MPLPKKVGCAVLLLLNEKALITCSYAWSDLKKLGFEPLVHAHDLHPLLQSKGCLQASQFSQNLSHRVIRQSAVIKAIQIKGSAPLCMQMTAFYIFITSLIQLLMH